MKTNPLSKPKKRMSSPHKPGANGSTLPITGLPPAQVSADQRWVATQGANVSHEPGQRPHATQFPCAGLESFARDGEGGGHDKCDNHRWIAASESFHGEGQRYSDTQVARADAVEGGGQKCYGALKLTAAPESLTGHDCSGAHPSSAGQDQGHVAADAQKQNALIQNIKARYRLRIFYRESADAIAKRLFSYCYQLTAADHDDSTPKGKAAHAAAATKLVKQTFSGEPPIELLALRCDLLIDHHRAMKDQQAEQEKAINKLVKGLPGWAWVEQFKGLGPGGFGEIVAHCGDLSKYSNPAKVWKRMGLAVLPSSKDGTPIAQRRCKDKADAELHGFSPRRRAVMHCFGEALLRARAHNPEYGEMYDRRKELEAAKPEVTTKMHAHKRALRYLEKRLLRDLWRAWRAESGQCLDAAPSHHAASAAEHLEVAA